MYVRSLSLSLIQPLLHLHVQALVEALLHSDPGQRLGVRVCEFILAHIDVCIYFPGLLRVISVTPLGRCVCFLSCL